MTNFKYVLQRDVKNLLAEVPDPANCRDIGSRIGQCLVNIRHPHRPYMVVGEDENDPSMTAVVRLPKFDTRGDLVSPAETFGLYHFSLGEIEDDFSLFQSGIILINAELKLSGVFARDSRPSTGQFFSYGDQAYLQLFNRNALRLRDYFLVDSDIMRATTIFAEASLVIH